MRERHTAWPRLARIADGLIVSAMIVTAVVLLLATSVTPWGR